MADPPGLMVNFKLSKPCKTLGPNHVFFEFVMKVGGHLQYPGPNWIKKHETRNEHPTENFPFGAVEILLPSQFQACTIINSPCQKNVGNQAATKRRPIATPTIKIPSEEITGV